MMVKKLIILVLLAFGYTHLLPGQEDGEPIAASLGDLYRRLLLTSDDNERLRINDSIKLNVDKYAESIRVFRMRFTNLKYLGQITSPDSALKILTWNLVLKNEPGRYYCYLIRKMPPGKSNIIYRLERSYNDDPIRTDTTYLSSGWYGALYYDIRPYNTPAGKTWILLGINLSDPYTTKKIIDAISFGPGDDIILGRKWFSTGDKILYRHVLKYSSSAIISLRFASDTSIVFDHLVPVPVESGDNRIHYGPDYSTDAFIFRDGLWNLSINVDARNEQK
jgi:hypothetical protein